MKLIHSLIEWRKGDGAPLRRFCFDPPPTQGDDSFFILILLISSRAFLADFSGVYSATHRQCT
jgi:hypothetical protein